MREEIYEREEFKDTYDFDFFGDLPTDKLYRHYVTEERYKSIKDMGPHDERKVKGVTALVDHSSEFFKQFIIIKTPRFI